VGKTTLVRLILGEIQPLAGAVSVKGRVGVLRQALAPPAGASVAELLGVEVALGCLRRIEAGDGTADDLAEADWGVEARLEGALAQMALAGLDLARPAASLSGGELTRALLAGLLAAEPDLLILDEPTNNLDAAARGLVAEVLGRWRGGAIVVSHDRALLRRMDRIVELTSLGARVYGGNYDLYAARKAEAEAAAARDLADAERAVERVAREVQVAAERKARRDAAGKRSRAKGDQPKIMLDFMAGRAEASGGRERRLAERRQADAAADLADAQGRVERLRRLTFDLPPSGLPAGRQVLAFEAVRHPRLGRPVSLRLAGPERVAVTGPNGAGKTTLIRLAVGELEPAAGEVRLGVPAALVDQQTAMLREDESLLGAYLRLNPRATANDAYAALARFLFRNTAAEKTVAALSGGERLRAALACVLSGEAPPQLLILDEPTNHLDLESVAAVEAALRGYDGALLVVSHDRDFLAAVGVGREVLLG
jgi:ATPase subunit of ABC transporter with duplicated ATPase domains